MKNPQILILIICLIVSSCAVKKTKNIQYASGHITPKIERTILNVFSPRKTNEQLPVLIYVHGGYWESGNKDIYGFFGRNFAKKDVVTVIPNYTLSPNADYKIMTQQIAAAINWTKDNIQNYNGNPDKIFVTGHSAGGHLVALASMDADYGVSGLISGIILNDAAGLDMYSYLQEYPPTTNHNYDVTWTKNPENWKEASPIYYISERTPPILMYTGSKTYESIISSNSDFMNELKSFQPKAKQIVLDKKHVPMITQYFWPWSDRFKEVIRFMNRI